MRKIFHLAVATVFGAGYFPVASGTFASALAVFPYYALRNNNMLYALVIIICFSLGVWTAGAAEEILQEKDSHKIVVDEVAGYLVAMAFLPQHWLYPVAGFFLFRLFDVWKPLWIRKTQDLPKGWGIMMDDIWAGILTNVLLRIMSLFPIELKTDFF
jgi:phosphatidylglycerophosphatase A